MEPAILQSELTCPKCGNQELLTMPTDSCQWYHECPNCLVLLKPIKGDCCVFCSYGSVPCPPIQLDGSCQISGGCCGNT